MVVCTHLTQDALLGQVGTISLLSNVDELCLDRMGKSLVDSHVRQRLCKTWPNVSNKKPSSEPQFTPLQSKLFNILNKYKVPCCSLQCVNASACCLLGYSLYK